MSSEKRVTMKDIGDRLGVSVCTVNKALTGKGRVSEDTRKLIIDTANKMGYHANKLAQALTRKAVTIGVAYPDTWPSYAQSLLAGLREGLQDISDYNVTGRFLRMGNQTFAEELTRAVAWSGKDAFDTMIIVPYYEHFSATDWSPLASLDIPLALLGMDIPDAPRLFCVRQDSTRCGRIAAELLVKQTGPGKMAAIIGSREVPEHHEKADGFQEEAARLSTRVVGVYETLGDPDIAYPVTRRIFTDHPDIKGLYVATENIEGVCRYLTEHGLGGTVKVVATGALAEVKSALDQDLVQFSLFQNMNRQGRQAIRLLYDYLLEDATPPEEVLVAPEIIVRGNSELW